MITAPPFMFCRRLVGIFTVLVAMANHYVYGLPCIKAKVTMAPCLPYLTSTNPTTPSYICCAAVVKVNEAASTTIESLRDMCDCLKKAAVKYGVRPDNAKQLPERCNVSVPVPIDPDIVCTSILLDTKMLRGREDHLSLRLGYLWLFMCCAGCAVFCCYHCGKRKGQNRNYRK